MKPDKFQIVKIENALMDYECQRLIDLYEETNIEFINDFYGFDIEYLNHRIEDITNELTGIDIINQEPTYITKSLPNGKIEPIRSDAWSEESGLINEYGNRIFTLIIFLSPGEILFPNINLRHITKAGDGIVWNNIGTDGRIIDSVNQISNNTYYIKKWVREKPFI